MKDNFQIFDILDNMKLVEMALPFLVGDIETW